MYEGYLNKWLGKVKARSIRQALWPSPEDDKVVTTVNPCVAVMEGDEW